MKIIMKKTNMIYWNKSLRRATIFQKIIFQKDNTSKVQYIFIFKFPQENWIDQMMTVVVYTYTDSELRTVTSEPILIMRTRFVGLCS